MSVYRERPQWLKESIESILNQSYRDIEFIIVLDNPDNTALEKIIKIYQEKDRRIQFYINEKNRGLVYSLNRALSCAKGSYIARMDADDISHPDRLKRQLVYLQKNHLDLIGSNSALFNERGVFYVTDKLLTHRYLKKMLYAGTIGIVHPTFFGKKEVFDVLEGYSEAPYAEDKEFLARVLCHGFHIGNMQEVLLECRYSEESVTKSNAVYVYKVGTYITQIFRECLKTGRYQFDAQYCKNLMVTQEETLYFNRKKLLLQEARDTLGRKKYFHFLRTLFGLLKYSGTVWENIWINFLLKWYRAMETLQKGRISW